MPGVPVNAGQVPKRSDQRRRRNKSDVPIDQAAGASHVEQPAPDESWHPIAKAWYESLANSGQARWYEPSDWATAYLIAESMSRDLNPQFVGISEVTGEVIERTIPLKGASLASYLKAMNVLLATEGDRRRMRIELQRGEHVDADEEAAVTALDTYRARFSS